MSLVPRLLKVATTQMYVDPKPLSTFGKTQGWKTPSLQPPRPNIQARSTSSSSSRRGKEQSVPSFQSFAKMTPPLDVDSHKPLPRTILRSRRASSSAADSVGPSSEYSRRSSSVYSRTVSHWGPPADPWRSTDLTEQDHLLLQPVAYSASDSQPSRKPSAPEPESEQEPEPEPYILQPRAYSPLVITPSPTASRAMTRSPPPESRPSELLPPPPSYRQEKQRKAKIVSLIEAKRSMNAPGAVHLLPEELRAQIGGKSRSQGTLQAVTMPDFANSPGGCSVGPHLPQTLFDPQGRGRLVMSPTPPAANKGSAEFNFLLNGEWSPSVEQQLVEANFKVGNGPARPMAPLANQPKKASREKAVQALGLPDGDESRGRPRQRGQRTLRYGKFKPNKCSSSSHSSSSYSDQEMTDAQRITGEYHSLLAQQCQQLSSSPGYRGLESDDNVKTHMKLVPQPLFHQKPGGISSIDFGGSRDGRRGSFTSGVSSTASSGHESFPLRLSLTPPKPQSRQISSGPIPISPPTTGCHHVNSWDFAVQEANRREMTNWRRSDEFVHQVKEEETYTTPKPRRRSEHAHISQFYPHVMQRRHKSKDRKAGKGKGKEKETTRNEKLLNDPQILLLAKDIIAQKLKTPDTAPGTSPLRPVSKTTENDTRLETSVNPKKAFYTRMARSAARYAGILTRPTGFPQKENTVEADTGRRPSIAQPHSLHLLHSPSSSKPPPTTHRLGWSDHIPNPFERKQPPSVGGFIHVQTPARALDESRPSLQEQDEADSPTKKGSISRDMTDGWQESKAQKRREDLKKTIRVVGTDVAAGGGEERR